MAAPSTPMGKFIAKGFAKSPHDAEYDDIRESSYVPPHKHFEESLAEIAAARSDRKSSRRTKVIVTRAIQEATPAGINDIDWTKELANFSELAYPDYYRRPFHSVPGGWLSKRAALQDRMFMQAIYKDAHEHSCMGLRDELSGLVPTDCKLVVDLGCGSGDGPAATARLRPSAEVIGIEASPFMLVAARHQNEALPNLHLQHSLAEATGLPDGCADCVTITLLFHECSDEGKVAIAQEAKRILKPNGCIIFADTPQDDLQTYIGALEPYRAEWKHFNPSKFFSWLGFAKYEDLGVLGGDGKVVTEKQQRELTGERTDNRLFVCKVTKPEATLRSKL